MDTTSQGHHNQPYYVRRLLAVKDIDTTIKDKEGKTAFDYINEQTDPEIIRLVRQYHWNKEQQQNFSQKHRRDIRQTEPNEPVVNKLTTFFNRLKNSPRQKPVDRKQYQPITSPTETKPMH